MQPRLHVITPAFRCWSAIVCGTGSRFMLRCLGMTPPAYPPGVLGCSVARRDVLRSPTCRTPRNDAGAQPQRQRDHHHANSDHERRFVAH